MMTKWSVLVIFAFLCAMPMSTTYAGSEPHRVEVSAKRFEFSPNEITAKKGEPLEIVITSSDVTHGLRFADLNQQIEIPKGAPVTLSFTPEKTGDFTGQCIVFCGAGHGDMALTLHVVE